MDKKEIRKTYLNIRKNINNKEQKDTKVFNEMIELKEYKESKQILAYVSLNDELDTFKLLDYSLKNGKKVAVPKCEGETINFYYINSLKELKKGAFGILEPQNENIVTNLENSVCIVPGVAFDKNNNRIGYGKGYYDRFLQNYKGIKIGLTYKECLCDEIKTDKTDIKVDKIIIG